MWDDRPIIHRVEIPDSLVELQTSADAERAELTGLEGDEHAARWKSRRDAAAAGQAAGTGEEPAEGGGGQGVSYRLAGPLAGLGPGWTVPAYRWVKPVPSSAVMVMS